jgi:sodium transport system permease protein
VAGVLLLASGRARSYKEFQLYHFPVFLVMLALGAAALLPGIVLRSGIVLVPVANLSVAIREVLTGRFDVPMLALAWLVSAATAALGARWTMASLSKEQLITAGGLDRGEWQGGAALFPKRVLLWFAVMWVAIFLGASSVPLLQNLHGQLLWNLVIVMLGGSLLMIRRYRLDLRQALALRPVKPVVLLAVVLGAPGLYLTGVALARLSGLLFPVPERLIEEFSRTLLPAGVPVGELLLLVAVLPGICEEIAFRGVLLHGLRRRYRPAVLCLVVGLIFGLFHLDLARILPTAFLGVALAAVTLLTGSLYPAMLWHALNNAGAILAGDAGVPVGDLGAGVYLAGALVAGLAFALLWKNRTPYPGLRGRPPTAPTAAQE